MLQEENRKHKEKQNVLKQEIHKMTTKMRRIEALMKRERNFTDEEILQLERELEDKLGELRDENSVLKERVRKLNMIHKGLSS